MEVHTEDRQEAALLIGLSSVSSVQCECHCVSCEPVPGLGRSPLSLSLSLSLSLTHSPSFFLNLVMLQNFTKKSCPIYLIKDTQMNRTHFPLYDPHVLFHAPGVSSFSEQRSVLRAGDTWCASSGLCTKQELSTKS